MNTNGLKIIIIDDEIAVFKAIQTLLGEKYHIEGYESSSEGINRIKEVEFDLLILDYYIDVLNAEQVVQKIREFNKRIYIIILTGFGYKISGLSLLEDLDIQSYYEKSADIKKIIIHIESTIKSLEFFRDKKSSIAERIKKLRKLNNLSQDDVAKYLEINRSVISLYESGDTVPPTMSIIKLAKLFNVTTDYILCYELNIEKINLNQK